MMRYIILPILLIISSVLFGQQAPQYSQYTFNNFGHNPAFAGSKKCLDFKAGGRFQWLGFEGAPRTYFASIHTPIGKKYHTGKGKHAIGAYVEQDRVHITTRTYFKLAYAYHKKLSPKFTGAAGIFGGVQQYAVDNVFGTNSADPVLDNASGSSLHYPDIMPGVLLYNNRFYMSLAVNQLYFHKIKLGGDQNKHRNQYLFGLGHQSPFGSWTVFKSILLKANNFGPPALDANLAWIYQQNLTFGLGYRAGESVVGSIKFRLIKDVTLTYAFDFPLNHIRTANAYGHEIMIGFSKCGGGGAGAGAGVKPHVCPAYN